jgi:hypothetical protein
MRFTSKSIVIEYLELMIEGTTNTIHCFKPNK